MNRLLFVALCALLMSACGGDGIVNNDEPGSGGGSDPAANTNVASQIQGGVAISEHNGPTTTNAIDEDKETSWVSGSGTPLLIKFEVVEPVQKIVIRKDTSTLRSGSNPDIVVELSLDGLNWKTSAITDPDNADIPCQATASSSTHIECTMSAVDAQYVRFTSQNGNAYEIKEIEVMAFH